MLLPIQYSKFIYYISYLSLISGLVGFYNKKYNFFFVPIIIFLTSINYWRYPVRGLRRNIDIICVCILFFYQNTSVHFIDFNIFWKSIYFILMTIGTSCYSISNRYHLKNNLYLSTVFHMCIHMCVNLANLILYCN
jgi:hypothetical protein